MNDADRSSGFHSTCLWMYSRAVYHLWNVLSCHSGIWELVVQSKMQIGIMAFPFQLSPEVFLYCFRHLNVPRYPQAPGQRCGVWLIFWMTIFFTLGLLWSGSSGDRNLGIRGERGRFYNATLSRLECTVIALIWHWCETLLLFQTVDWNSGNIVSVLH